MRTRILAPGLLAGVALLGLATPAAAQTEPAPPQLVSADITITLSADGDDVVRGTYRLAEPADAPTPLELLVVPRTGAEVTELTAGDGLTDLGPVEGIRAGATLPSGTTEYTVEQRVQRSADEYGIPLAIPDVATGRGADVRITVALPEGQRLVGDAMPAFDVRAGDGDRVELSHTGRSLPSVIVAEYGTTSRASLGTVSSYTGLVLITLVIAGWLFHSIRKERVRP
ncbi:hypothetical protein [Prauserella cavernicola]|uniref:Uncharacterized protein n=1 Tax=Prauserella cavernicola TaxID=2800127 RepID=A0A934QZ50_9PSEU|nr:hypothetical protein [Prauserella cavernicola]MBK1789435.1 hypothetical protein [Prauserella cavernicola]